MAKQAEKKKELMIQRVNLSDSILKTWENNFLRTVKVPIHKFLLTETDIHNKFTVKIDEEERTFSLEGMTPEEFVILKEYNADEDLYWLCKYEYAQLLMSRFNKKIYFSESTDKKTKIKTNEQFEKFKEYTPSQLYLPSRQPKSRKAVTETEIDKNMEEDATGFLFNDEETEQINIPGLEESDEEDNYIFETEDEE